MARNPWTLVALALTAAGAIAAAAPRTNTPDDKTPALQTRPTSPAQLCDDSTVGETFGGTAQGCREYLDACLGDLSSAQRAEWRQSVDACLASPDRPLYSCYAQVPWC